MPCVRTVWLLLAFSLPVIAADPALHFDFARDQPGMKLIRGARRVDGAIEFTNPLQYAEVPFSKKLDGIDSITVGVWVYPKRSGEQAFFFRGIPECGPNGERMFRPQDKWVNWVVGTDQHGFYLATANGNSTMPFPHVTLNEVPIDSWSQLVYVKDARGYQTFYRNGTAVHSDKDAAAAGTVWPFRDVEVGEPVRLSVPLGGKIGEAWVYPRALSADEIRKDFEAKKDRYKPALPAKPVELREMDAHPAAGLWDDRGGPVTRETWPRHRERILRGVEQVLGPFPKEKVPLDPKDLGEVDCGSYVRRTVSIQVQPGDRMPAYLLIPKHLKGKVPAIVCFYGTTSGAGKDTTVGLSGGKPGTPPERNRAFAVDMVEAGFVAFAADYLRDGERIKAGRRPYDTTAFYKQFPDWSIHGKDAWDTMRAIDYLQSMDFVDPDRIGMVGHSYGGHSTIFTTALEPRIKAAWANGPVSDFRHHGLHWAVPKGGGASQSLPAMRPFVLDHTLPIPVTFFEWTALIAPRPPAVGQAVGERRPMEEENHAGVRQVYQALRAADRVKYVWSPGDHDFPPAARRAAVDWFKTWLAR
jgi:dienelactone hydrolase